MASFLGNMLAGMPYASQGVQQAQEQPYRLQALQDQQQMSQMKLQEAGLELQQMKDADIRSKAEGESLRQHLNDPDIQALPEAMRGYSALQKAAAEQGDVRGYTDASEKLTATQSRLADAHIKQVDANIKINDSVAGALDGIANNANNPEAIKSGLATIANLKPELTPQLSALTMKINSQGGVMSPDDVRNAKALSDTLKANKTKLEEQKNQALESWRSQQLKIQEKNAKAHQQTADAATARAQAAAAKSPAAKDMTEGVRKALNQTIPMVTANKEIDILEGKGVTKIPFLGSIHFDGQGIASATGRFGINRELSPDEQSLVTAAMFFGEAAGHLQSGARVTKAAFDRVVAEYIPQPGDSKQTLAIKKEHRMAAQKAAIESLPERAQKIVEDSTSGPSVLDTKGKQQTGSSSSSAENYFKGLGLLK